MGNSMPCCERYKHRVRNNCSPLYFILCYDLTLPFGVSIMICLLFCVYRELGHVLVLCRWLMLMGTCPNRLISLVRWMELLTCHRKMIGRNWIMLV